MQIVYCISCNPFIVESIQMTSEFQKYLCLKRCTDVAIAWQILIWHFKHAFACVFNIVCSDLIFHINKWKTIRLLGSIVMVLGFQMTPFSYHSKLKIACQNYILFLPTLHFRRHSRRGKQLIGFRAGSKQLKTKRRQLLDVLFRANVGNSIRSIKAIGTGLY
jgi:hypothetical protein